MGAKFQLIGGIGWHQEAPFIDSIEKERILDE